MVDFTFNHINKDLLDACGVSEEQIEGLFDKMNEVGQTCTSQSECVEKMASNFTPEELSFVINHLQAQVRHLEQSSPIDFLREMLQTSKEDDDLPPLSKGGEA